MERINLKKITKTLKYLQRITGGIFTSTPADVIVQIAVKRDGKEMKITFDQTGEMAEIIYNIGGQTIIEHIREPKTIQKVIWNVLNTYQKRETKSEHRSRVGKKYRKKGTNETWEVISRGEQTGKTYWELRSFNFDAGMILWLDDSELDKGYEEVIE